MEINGKFVKGLFAMILQLFLITLLDIYVIVYLWLPIRCTSFGSPLPWFWWIPMNIIVFFLSIVMWWLVDSKLPLLNYLFHIFGIEDTLFYLISQRGIPDVYHGIYYLGIFYAPSKHIVLLGNLVAVGVALTLLYGLKETIDW